MLVKLYTLTALVLIVLPVSSLYGAPVRAPVSPVPKDAITQGSVTIDGSAIRYTATAGTITLRNAAQEPIASVFYVSYIKNGVRNTNARPITFAYNGGPGSSSVYVDIGGFGPRRLVIPSDASDVPSAPYQLVNNPYSILNKSDVVFIDPVGTGYSHPLGTAKGQDFWGVDEDVRSLATFVEQYLAQTKRWNSPKYLFGESYGTFRTAALANYLQDQGVYLNGIVLLSSVLNFEASVFAAGNDLPYAMYLPSYAATAWYHNLLGTRPADLKSFLAKVESFSVHQYMPALMQGDSLPAAEKDKIAEQLSAYTGLTKAYWLKANLRVPSSQFEKELLSDKDLVTGRLDTRYVNTPLTNLTASRELRVMHSAIFGAFTGAMNYYLSAVLHYQTDRKYMMSGPVGSFWNWKHVAPYDEALGNNPRIRIDTTVPDLRHAMIMNHNLSVMVNAGYFDLGTPYFATQYSIDELNLPASLRSHVQMFHYQVGHMFYLNTKALSEFHSNYEKFMDETGSGPNY